MNSPMLNFALCLASLSGAALAQPVVDAAGLLTDAAGRVLYVFDKDSEARSRCTDACAALWPPFTADADARPVGEYALFTRDDGRRQWALRGRPLYFYAGDQRPGESAGDGVKGVWHVIRSGAAPAAAGNYRPDGY
ncbi:COG4315 family predicted lipoprotein [Methyloversatilis thermotolerans]|uniref:COG4315 family predicted lipoprotein n=1 Tax=Methyloversatilis thermotolerans TaxID=1346290 RepID=UPI001E65CDF5|nr:hypothetical protein [Methyloversatilis thermotolerans]